MHKYIHTTRKKGNNDLMNNLLLLASYYSLVHTATTSYTMYVQYVRACVRRAKFCDLRLYPNIIIFIFVVNVILL